MKFGNGCWLYKENCAGFSPAEAFYTDINDSRVTITAPTHKIQHRGDTLGGVNLTLEITAPRKNMIRVRTAHYLGTALNEPAFELAVDQDNKMEVRDNKEMLIVRSGSASLIIDKENWQMSYYWDNELKCTSGSRDLAYLKTDWKGDAYSSCNDDDSYMRQQFTISVGELFYGLGERFTPFVKNGQTVDIWQNDGGTSTEQAYKNIPFYLSSKDYGIFVNQTEKVSFEIGTENVNKIAFSVPGEKLDYIFIGGDSLKDVLGSYTDLTGKPAVPAPWTFGLWLSTSFTTNYDEKTVMSFIDGMQERGIPLSVFHFDSYWMKGFQWCDFEWDSDVFPDPAGMLQRIKDKGIKICVWINPYIAQASPLFREGMENGYFLKNKAGSVWQWDMWQPGMAIVDFTNPDARAWYQSKLKRLMDMGVDCFKTDFGERIPTDCVYYDGSDPVKMHNYYTQLYNQSVFELIEQERGKGEAVLFARSATVGGQKFPVHWGGDCWSDYESMEQSLRGGLSLLMSGFGFWSHDIGGFESQSTADVYKRWCAFGLLSSHSRLHGSTSYRVPWNYDEEAVEVLRFFTRLKMRLMPYIYQAAITAGTEGTPVMRSMILEFEDDHMCRYLDKQYMLGDSILTAPVLNDQGIGEYYLPEGTWTEYLTGRQRQGGRWYRETFGYSEIPLLVRQGSVIPVGAQDDEPVYDYAGGVTLKAYLPEDGDQAETVVPDHTGKPVLNFSIERKENRITAALQGGSAVKVELINMKAKDADGAHIENIGANTILTDCQDSFTVWLED